MNSAAQQLQKEQDALLYQPAPFVSNEFRREFNRIVPLSPNGKDRFLRFAWGCDRKDVTAGVKVSRYGDTDHTPPKYVGRCRWILEGWQSPDIYDEAEWKAAGELLGEFPRDGVWDFICVHEDAEGNYLPLDESALRLARQWAYWRGEGHKRSVEHLMQERALRHEMRQQERQAAMDAVAQKFGEDVVKEFEKAKDTPDAFSFASNVRSQNIGGAYETSPGGILIPRN